eukprot:TRINITY_DN3771_c0_g1_i1.p1 TRINITY_DN3771_c0_g1~~TRINITY_DN3771_c0_g1_i1.p1  ORF type:complete len:193 (-),score=49.59 TRINITY_DN3771_c0_g1_i1:180-758(-)
MAFSFRTPKLFPTNSARMSGQSSLKMFQPTTAPVKKINMMQSRSFFSFSRPMFAQTSAGHDHHHGKESPAQNKTIESNLATHDRKILSPEELAVGDEALEMKYGEEAFGKDTFGGPAFGVENDPVIVYSELDERIVGCIGSEENEHELLWHIVAKKKPTVCLECGQFFKLEPVHGHGHGHDHGHGHGHGHAH